MQCLNGNLRQSFIKNLMEKYYFLKCMIRMKKHKAQLKKILLSLWIKKILQQDILTKIIYN